jgi:hypothetical protein
MKLFGLNGSLSFSAHRTPLIASFRLTANIFDMLAYRPLNINDLI